jgi:hypothetical protein
LSKKEAPSCFDKYMDSNLNLWKHIQVERLIIDTLGRRVKRESKLSDNGYSYILSENSFMKWAYDLKETAYQVFDETQKNEVQYLAFSSLRK